MTETSRDGYSRSAAIGEECWVVRYVIPEYGIGYARPAPLGPTWYAIGICQGFPISLTKAEYEQKLTISRWANAMRARVWQRGVLRDVYPWNFLTQPQLSASV